MPKTPAEILAQVKRAIREKYTFPGGYPLYIQLACGDALSVEAAHAEWGSVCSDTLHSRRGSDSWAALGAEVNWEDESLTCSHTGELIEAAYPEA